MNRVLQSVSWVVSLAVLAVGVLFLAAWPTCLFYALRHWAHTRHWPSYNNPDPGSLAPGVGGAVLSALAWRETTITGVHS